MQIENIINEISTNLSIIFTMVEMKNQANLNDINTLLENPFKDIINIIYNYNLINLNAKYLYPAVDLGDKNKKIAFQITSVKDIKKIKETLKKFDDNNLIKDYHKLKFLIIKEETNYRKKDLDTNFFSMKEDIISGKDLIRIIKNLDLDKQKLINNKLKEAIGFDENISLDEIYKNRKNIEKIEEDYTEKIAVTKSILSSQIPKELENYFEVKPKLLNEKMKYELKPKQKDSYEKFPIHEKFTIKFSSEEEKKKFQKNGGIYGLIKEANVTRKAVEIPNINNVKEFLGEYENPFSTVNKNRPLKYYILPSELPKAEKFKINIIGDKEHFCIRKTMLQRVYADKNQVILKNIDATDEPFNITLIFNIIESNQEMIKINFNINIELREKYRKSCKYNLEYQKFLFAINEENVKFEILKEKEKFLSTEKHKNDSNQEKEYKSYIKYKRLLNKIIYIEKNHTIEIPYDIEYFYENEDKINIIYYDCKNTACKFKEPLTITSFKTDFKEKKYENIVIDLPKMVEMFNHKFYFNNKKLYLLNCKFLKESIIDNKKAITLISKEVYLIPEKK